MANAAQLLKNNDQFRNQKSAFQVFTEPHVFHLPTYKFLPGTNKYSTRLSKNSFRVPSYTDKILYHTQTANILTYDTLDIYSSDHRPVFAIFECQIPQTETTDFDCSGGYFDRDVYLSGMNSTYRKLNRTPKEYQKSNQYGLVEVKRTKVCSIL